MKSIKIKCPAKINLDLKIIGKRSDGFHEIESVMQTIDLYDILTIKIYPSEKNEIILSGNSTEIPYDERNLVYKAAKLFLNSLTKSCHSKQNEESHDYPQGEFLRLKPKNNHIININIDKHIPVAAGLAGGSTDAAGTLYGLNILYNKPLTNYQLHELCTKLGSDLNVCLQGGRSQCKGRGEIIEPLAYKNFNLSLIKPNNLGISAKEAYTKFSQKNQNDPARNNFANDLEWAVINDYPQLQYIKKTYPNSIMTGSGSAYYLINEKFLPEDNYIVINGLKSIPFGVKEDN